MSTPIRIAYVGPAGSGKTTMARRSQKAWGGDVLSFATPLKKLTRDLFDEAMEDENYARNANQVMGVAARQVDAQVWVRKLMAKVSANRPVFVDDARFHNEYSALKQIGFVFIRLKTDPKVLEERRPTMTAAQWSHVSETEAASIPGDWVVPTDDQDVEKAFFATSVYLETMWPKWFEKKASHAGVA